MLKRWLFLIPTVGGWFAAQLFAASPVGSITGVVSDAQGAVVANVKVTVTNESTNVSREVLTPTKETSVPF